MDERTLQGLRVLVVEDEYIIATDLMATLEEAGAQVTGPVSDVERAIEVVEEADFKPDCVVLDINLHGEVVYPAAQFLAERGIPFLFVTGYECSSMPKEFADVPCFTKPIDEMNLIMVIATVHKKYH